jgi:hypothetical protein
MAATIPIIGLMIWLLFIRKPRMNKPMIWLSVGVLFISLSYRFTFVWAAVGLVLISLIFVRLNQIEP